MNEWEDDHMTPGRLLLGWLVGSLLGTAAALAVAAVFGLTGDLAVIDGAVGVCGGACAGMWRAVA